MTAAKRTAPISSHPAFKWGVAAWFALLLGLGLFVMPPAIHAVLAERIGIAGILSDSTAIRAALSLIAAALGLLIGLVLAIRVAAINEASREEDDDEGDSAGIWLQDREDEQEIETEPAPLAAAAPRRPFNPREDIGEEGIGMAGRQIEDESPAEPEAPAESGDTPGIDQIDGRAEDRFIAEDWEEPLPETGIETDIAPAWDHSRDPPGIAAEAPSDAPLPEARDTAAIADAVGSEVQPQDLDTPTNDTVMPAAIGDLPLDALTERLGAALAALKTGPYAQAPDEADPVIASLRREAEREAPGPVPSESPSDPQAELRSALDKLSRVGKPE
ncbi:MAG: hypothetical protein CL510_01470 [Actinobacteria bacterium]|nr:hypothetical protein [Actinomycetota bacterium]